MNNLIIKKSHLKNKKFDSNYITNINLQLGPNENLRVTPAQVLQAVFRAVQEGQAGVLPAPACTRAYHADSRGVASC